MLPQNSKTYSEKSYWDTRFQTEASHDWLATYAQLRPLLLPYIRPASRILILGNGNSPLPLALASDGFLHVLATDYSEVVVERMRAAQAPTVSWACADMLRLPEAPLPHAGAYDCVIDKGALDAIVSAQGDSWAPPAADLAASHAVCAGVAALLRPGGCFICVSFSQPHFRTPHLLQREGAGAAPAPPAPALAASSGGEDSDFEPDLNPGAARPPQPALEGSLWSSLSVQRVEAGLGYFCYILTK